MSSKIKRLHKRYEPQTGEEVAFCAHPAAEKRTNFRVPGHTRSPNDRVRWLSACAKCVKKYKVPRAIPIGEFSEVEMEG